MSGRMYRHILEVSFVAPSSMPIDPTLDHAVLGDLKWTYLCPPEPIPTPVVVGQRRRRPVGRGGVVTVLATFGDESGWCWCAPDEHVEGRVRDEPQQFYLSEVAAWEVVE